MPIGKRAVGDRIYVFSANDGRQSASTCVIDCHGEQKLFGNGFDVNDGESVVFYTEQGAPMTYHNGSRKFADDPGENFNYETTLKAIATGVGVAVETIDGPGNCPDYNLTKIQRTTKGCINGQFTNWVDERSQTSYDDIEQFLKYYPHSRDIVTIRNRSVPLTAVTLSEVIQALRQNGYGYTAYHCSFCRSSQVPLIQPSKPAQVVKGSDKPGGGVY